MNNFFKEIDAMKKWIGLSLLSLLSTPCFAMFCPTNFNEIYIGDSIDKVIAQCGKPTSQTSDDQAPSKPQEWVYYLKLNPTDTATVRTTFGIVKDKVTNMTVNGVGITTSTICNGNTVSVGDAVKSVKASCGDPAMVNESNMPPAPSTVKMVTKMVYSGTNSTTLVFEDGKLKQRN